MATIEIPDSMVPEGYEPDPILGAARNGQLENQLSLTVYLRRKPRLKKIVFTVAGDKRIIMPGEWYETVDGEFRKAISNTSGVYFPLERSEVYE